MLYLNHHKTKKRKELPRMTNITQDMRYRLSLIKYAEKYGVAKAAIKYKTNRQYIFAGNANMPARASPCAVVPVAHFII